MRGRKADDDANITTTNDDDDSTLSQVEVELEQELSKTHVFKGTLVTFLTRQYSRVFIGVTRHQVKLECVYVAISVL